MLIKFVGTRWKIAMLEGFYVTLVQEFNFQSCWPYDRYACDHSSIMHLKCCRLSKLEATVFKLFSFLTARAFVKPFAVNNPSVHGKILFLAVRLSEFWSLVAFYNFLSDYQLYVENNA